MRRTGIDGASPATNSPVANTPTPIRKGFAGPRRSACSPPITRATRLASM